MTRDAPAPGDGLELAPFRGLRFAPAAPRALGRVTAPPYDTLDAEQARRLLASGPHHMVRVVVPNFVDASPRPYQAAAALLAQWRRAAVLRPDPAPALYVYEHRSPGSDGELRPVQRGLLGALGLRSPRQGAVLPHEDTLPGPVEDRLELLRATGANLEPILLSYAGGGPAGELTDRAVALSEPLIRARLGERDEHLVWAITDPDWTSVIAEDLAPRQALIADGHHRYAAALAYRDERRTDSGPGPWDRGLALLVDQRRWPLRIAAIHRVVDGLRLDDAVSSVSAASSAGSGSDSVQGLRLELVKFGRDAAGATEALADDQERAHRYLLTDGRDWTLLIAPRRPGVPDTLPLHEHLLPHLWRISEDRVGYVHADDGPAELQARLAEEGTDRLAILLNPVSITTVHQTAAAGITLPRKSTSFSPKPRSGFVLRAHDT